MSGIARWLDQHLVPGWRGSWAWWGNQAALVVGAIALTISSYPDLLIALASMLGGTPELQAGIIGITMLIITLRMWDQREQQPTAEQDDGSA